MSIGCIECLRGGKWQAIKEHSSLSKLGLAHMRHLIVTASSNNSVDDGFSDHLGAM